jgi:hypothetical protein
VKEDGVRFIRGEIVALAMLVVVAPALAKAIRAGDEMIVRVVSGSLVSECLGIVVSHFQAILIWHDSIAAATHIVGWFMEISFEETHLPNWTWLTRLL